MNSPPSTSARSTQLSNQQGLLLPQHIQMIEEALRTLGEYGEIRLIVEKGQLRFLVTQKSYDALKYQPGSLDNNSTHSNSSSHAFDR